MWVGSAKMLPRKCSEPGASQHLACKAKAKKPEPKAADAIARPEPEQPTIPS
jgi:hypothetical protein